MDVLQKAHPPIIEETHETNSHEDATVLNHPVLPRQGGWKWWLLVALSITFLLSGQSVGTLLGKFYYGKGGDSIWLATLVQSAAFPILFLPLLLFPSSPPTATTPPSVATLAFVYISLGLLIAGDNLMYSYGLLYLPVSTYSLICATQLGFNALFSFFINSQKLTPFVVNSIVILTLSASLVAIHKGSDESSSRESTGKHDNRVIGILCTLGASVTYSFLLSLNQFSFEKILKKEALSVILEVQIYPSAVATCVCLVGLFASGEWKHLKGEMEGFHEGRMSYLMTLVWTAVAWQVYSIGSLGVIFVLSSLFCTVIGTLTLPVVPVVGVFFYHEKLDAVKVVAMILAVWGFLSYIYQQYLDDEKSKTTMTDLNEIPHSSS